MKTDSKKEALRLLGIQNAQVESYWKCLIESGRKYTADDWKAFNKHTRLARFTADNKSPHPVAQNFAVNTELMPNSLSVSAAAPDSLRLSQCLKKFWRFEKPKILNKSPNQIRKWENPRKLAIKNLIVCIGDKALIEIARDDILTFREWWMERMEVEKLTPVTINKSLIHVKSILTSVSDNMKLGIDIDHLFRKIILTDNEDEKRRPPFTTEFIIGTLLKPENLAGLNEQARWVLYAIAETGAGISEQLGLLPEDIILDHEVPHLVIVPRQKMALKTKYRKRTIPLVGYALDAFKSYPQGFTDYRDRPDSLSGTLNNYLKDNGLLPSDKHTVYSLRHSFQDRLLAVNAPDRVQADLMGHKFNRPTYGDGASLKQRLEWLEKIQLKTS